MPGVRSEITATCRIGRNNRFDQLIADQTLSQIADTLIRASGTEYVIAAGEQNVVFNMGDVVDGRLWWIVCEGGDLQLTFGGVPGTAATLLSGVGTYNTGFATNTPFEFVLDGVTVTVTFTSADQTRTQVIQRINAAAVLAGLSYLPASPESASQIRLRGADESASGDAEITVALAQIGFPTVGVTAVGTDPRADGAPLAMRRCATAGTVNAASMQSFLIGTIQAASLIISNLSDTVDARVYIVVAGDIDPSPGVC
jgi:hypothetical protein